MNIYSIKNMIDLILKAIWFILPAYCANSLPPLISKLKIRKYNRPIDNGFKINNKALFGKNKTWFGLIFGIIGGTLIGGLQSTFTIENLSFLDFQMTLTIAVFLATGALIGDLMGSLIKRRLNYNSGKQFPVLDQLDFLIGALFFGSLITTIELQVIIILLFLTPIAHISGNFLAYKLKIKKVPW